MSSEIASSMKLKLVSTKKVLFEGNVEEVTLPGLEGYLGILPGHRPLFTALGEGKLSFQREGRKRDFSVRGGYAEVKPNTILVFINPRKDKNESSTEERE